MKAPSRETRKPVDTRMPVWARIIAGIIGATLFVGGIVGVFAIRPFDYETAWLCVGATVPGMVLLAAAISGQWPLFII